MKKNSELCMKTTADWIMRIALAFIFILAGYKKLFIVGPEQFATMLNMPILLGWMATFGELGGGIGIIIGGLMKSARGEGARGFPPKGGIPTIRVGGAATATAKIKTGDRITRLSGALIAFIMLVAFFTVKIKGFDTDFFKGLQGSSDVIALFAMGLFYTLTGNRTR